MLSWFPVLLLQIHAYDQGLLSHPLHPWCEDSCMVIWICRKVVDRNLWNRCLVLFCCSSVEVWAELCLLPCTGLLILLVWRSLPSCYFLVEGLIVEGIYFLYPFLGSSDLIHDSFGTHYFGSNCFGGIDHRLESGSCHRLGSLDYSLPRIGCLNDSLRCLVWLGGNLQYLVEGLRMVCFGGSLHLLVWLLGSHHYHCFFVSLFSGLSCFFFFLHVDIECTGICPFSHIVLFDGLLAWYQDVA